MLLAISSLAEQCYMWHYGPLKEMPLLSKLDMIQVNKNTGAEIFLKSELFKMNYDFLFMIIARTLDCQPSSGNQWAFFGGVGWGGDIKINLPQTWKWACWML